MSYCKNVEIIKQKYKIRSSISIHINVDYYNTKNDMKQCVIKLIKQPKSNKNNILNILDLIKLNVLNWIFQDSKK